MKLNKVKELKGYKIHCSDGNIGKVKEFLFDDHHWTVRYLVVDTGGWLTGRQVLISPYALHFIDDVEKTISVNLTKKQIEGSPSIQTDLPVSRQFEDDYNQYYGWPGYYWGAGAYSWGPSNQIMRERANWQKLARGQKSWDHHLRSTNAVTSYAIVATDGEIGHVDDFVIDPETWAIRYLVVDTRNWWPGKKVLISPLWIDRVSWHDSDVYVSITRDEIKSSPEFTNETLISRDYESGLYGHYDRKGYWTEEVLV